jgi:5-methylthioribose kinase
LEHDLAEKLIEKINQDISIVKSAWNHGDHNQYNIFDNGVIDLEDSFYGPIGYDTITSLTQNFWFPDSRKSEIGELTRQHSFTKEQLQTYLTSIQNNGS